MFTCRHTRDAARHMQPYRETLGNVTALADDTTQSRQDRKRPEGGALVTQKQSLPVIDVADDGIGKALGIRVFGGLQDGQSVQTPDWLQSGGRSHGEGSRPERKRGPCLNNRSFSVGATGDGRQ